MADISTTWLKISYWFIANRRDVTKWWVLVLLACVVFMIIFVVGNSFVLLSSFSSVDRTVSLMGTENVASRAQVQAVTPVPLEVSQAQTVISTGEAVLYVAEIENPNTLWSARSVDYIFENAGRQTETRTTFLLPGERRVLLATDAIGKSATVSITNVTWLRVPPLSLPEVSVTFTPAQHRYLTVSTVGQQKAVSEVATTLSNETLYRIQNIKVIVLVKNGNTIVGARQAFIENVTPQESRELTLQFPDALPAFTTIELFSEIDVFTPGVVGL